MYLSFLVLKFSTAQDYDKPLTPSNRMGKRTSTCVTACVTVVLRDTKRKMSINVNHCVRTRTHAVYFMYVRAAHLG